jgi:hypothetical protein
MCESEEGFKKVLDVPDVMSLYLIIPISDPDVSPKEGVRCSLTEIFHSNKYDRSKHMSKYVKAPKAEGGIHR